MLVKEDGSELGVEDRPIGCDLDSPLDLVSSWRNTIKDSDHIHPVDRGQLCQFAVLALAAGNHPPELVSHMGDHHIFGWQRHPSYFFVCWFGQRKRTREQESTLEWALC